MYRLSHYRRALGYARMRANALLKRTEIKSSQDKLLKESYNPNVSKLIIFLTPGFDEVNGGILSISSICEETKKLDHLHGAEVIMCTIPGDPLLLKYTKFENSNHLYRFPQVLSYFQNLQNLMIHIPEFCLKKFLRSITHDDYSRLKKIKDVHINILLQNIAYLSPMQFIERLKELGKLTCTTNHEKYSSLEIRKRLGIPLHKLSWFLSPELYKKKSYVEKEDLMVVSKDIHPKKSKVLNLIARHFPDLKIQIIQNLTYEQYKNLIPRAKWMLTFGEGLDGYFVETVFSGSISFSVYRPEFFTEDFRSLRTVYDDYDFLIENILLDIKNLDNEATYTNYQREQFALCSKYFKHEEYVKNIQLFYEGKYTYK
jgi:hypothetical protein